ncbi:MAG: hypothetical protein GEU98_05945 [Pseudonocardiaceae bacterium]|nr:hypothetical protein [Pseudonocardiaceae bacterium]
MATEQDPSTSRPRRAGAFDVRMIIALLLGIYGVVLLIMGIGFTTDAEEAKAAGVNINLWAGLGMTIAALAFVGWARWRPILVPTEGEEGTEDHPSGK